MAIIINRANKQTRTAVAIATCLFAILAAVSFLDGRGGAAEKASLNNYFSIEESNRLQQQHQQQHQRRKLRNNARSLIHEVICDPDGSNCLPEFDDLIVEEEEKKASEAEKTTTLPEFDDLIVEEEEASDADVIATTRDITDPGETVAMANTFVSPSYRYNDPDRGQRFPGEKDVPLVTPEKKERFTKAGEVTKAAKLYLSGYFGPSRQEKNTIYETIENFLVLEMALKNSAFHELDVNMQLTRLGKSGRTRLLQEDDYDDYYFDDYYGDEYYADDGAEEVPAPAQTKTTPVPPPVTAPVPKPVPPPVTAPVPKPVPPPVTAPVPKPVPPPVTAPVTAPVPKPVPPPVPQPVSQPQPKPVSPPVSQPTANPPTTKTMKGDPHFFDFSESKVLENEKEKTTAVAAAVTPQQQQDEEPQTRIAITISGVIHVIGDWDSVHDFNDEQATSLLMDVLSDAQRMQVLKIMLQESGIEALWTGLEPSWKDDVKETEEEPTSRTETDPPDNTNNSEANTGNDDDPFPPVNNDPEVEGDDNNNKEEGGDYYADDYYYGDDEVDNTWGNPNTYPDILEGGEAVEESNMPKLLMTVGLFVAACSVVFLAGLLIIQRIDSAEEELMMANHNNSYIGSHYPADHDVGASLVDHDDHRRHHGHHHHHHSPYHNDDERNVDMHAFDVRSTVSHVSSVTDSHCSRQQASRQKGKNHHHDHHQHNHDHQQQQQEEEDAEHGSRQTRDFANPQFFDVPLGTGEGNNTNNNNSSSNNKNSKGEQLPISFSKKGGRPMRRMTPEDHGGGGGVVHESEFVARVKARFT